MGGKVMRQEDLEFLKLIIEKHSFRLGCSLKCQLFLMDKNSAFIEQRKKLRVRLAEAITEKWSDKLSKKQFNSLLIPGSIPQLPFVSVSMAHSADVGGFILSSASYSMGFDLERQGRARKKTVLRISRKEEVDKSPSPCALWSAKESAYKAVNLLKRDVYIKKIFVFNWQTISLVNYKELIKIDSRDSLNGNEGLKKKHTRQELENLENLQVYDYQFQIEDRDPIGKGYICFMKDIVVGFAVLH